MEPLGCCSVDRQSGTVSLGHTASALLKSPTNRVSRRRATSATPTQSAYSPYEGSNAPDRVLSLLEVILENQERSLKANKFEDKDPSDRILATLDVILDKQSSLLQSIEQNNLDIHKNHQAVLQNRGAIDRLDDDTLMATAITRTVEDALSRVAHAEDGAPAQLCPKLGDNIDGQPPPLFPMAATTIEKPTDVPKRETLAARIIASNRFELFMAFVIIGNMFIMFISLQLKGNDLGYKLGAALTDPSWDTHEPNLAFLENILNGIYVIELTMRVWVFGRKFIYSFGNMMDAFIVVSSCTDVYILQPFKIQFINLSVLRLVRLSRVLKLAKVLRSSPFFSELRVLIRTLCIAVKGIVWSIVLLLFIIVAGGILMTQLAISFLDSDSIELERRIWLYTNFGTTMAAMHTMFECTFTGGWRFYSRPLIDEISYMFAIFWIIWVVLVNFTTMRVIGALFLKDTMAVSARDAENCAMNQLKHKGASAEKLRLIFNDADTSGDGCIGEAEFDAMMEKSAVVDEFALLGLDRDEVTSFFTVLAADDGTADYNEFITGALAMASSAPTLDRLKALQNQMRIEANVHENLHLLKLVCEASGIPTEPQPSGIFP